MIKEYQTKLGKKQIEVVDWEHFQIPKTIYKYRDWKNDFHRKIILHQELFVPSPSTFNDPFDCKIPVAYELISSDKNIAKSYFKNFVSAARPNFTELEINKEVESYYQNLKYLIDRKLKNIKNSLLKNYTKSWECIVSRLCETML